MHFEVYCSTRKKLALSFLFVPDALKYLIVGTSNFYLEDETIRFYQKVKSVVKHHAVIATDDVWQLVVLIGAWITCCTLLIGNRKVHLPGFALQHF